MVNKNATSNQQALVDDFIKNEQRKAHWIDKFIGYPKVMTTKSASGPLQGLQFGREKVIRYPVINKIFPYFFLLHPFFIQFMLFKTFLEDASIRLFLIVPFFLVVLFEYVFIKIAFNKTDTYDITINKEGININNQNILWNTVAETCLMEATQGSMNRPGKVCLIIFKKDKTIGKFWLTGFGKWAVNNIAAIIEYYKAVDNSSI